VKHIVKQTKNVIHHKIKTRKHVDPNDSAVDSRDVKLTYLTEEAKISLGEGMVGAEANKRLDAEVQHREKTRAIFEAVFPEQFKSKSELIVEPENYNCLRYLVDTHDKFCTPFEDYSLKYVKYLVNKCETGTDK